MRLSFIKAKLHVQNIEKKLKSKEKLDAELDMISFEQLQSENKNLKKKLGDRKNEIKRYRDKLNDSRATIANVKDDIDTSKLASQEHNESILKIDKENSLCGKELSILTTEYKRLQNDFKIQSNAITIFYLKH